VCVCVCVCVFVGAESNYSNAVGNKDGGKRLNSFQQGMSAETEISVCASSVLSCLFIHALEIEYQASSAYCSIFDFTFSTFLHHWKHQMEQQKD